MCAAASPAGTAASPTGFRRSSSAPAIRSAKACAARGMRRLSATRRSSNRSPSLTARGAASSAPPPASPTAWRVHPPIRVRSARPIASAPWARSPTRQRGPRCRSATRAGRPAGPPPRSTAGSSPPTARRATTGGWPTVRSGAKAMRSRSRRGACRPRGPARTDGAIPPRRRVVRPCHARSHVP